MTDNDLKTISEKIDSLHKKILESKFAAKVTESEMVSLILAVQELNRQKAEIEMLQKAIKVQDIMIEQQEWKIKAAKSEAIKEFAERLKQMPSVMNCEYEWVHIDIDNLVKEMVDSIKGE